MELVSRNAINHFPCAEFQTTTSKIRSEKYIGNPFPSNSRNATDDRALDFSADHFLSYFRTGIHPLHRRKPWLASFWILEMRRPG